ncbi:site-specific integrase [Pseudonocardia sp. GCM10023141]|uniref:site-specific integrase n=1 Tax=Pseudonocardia sp. GCM10023141 TaxID=3252653 RepID=UPI003620B77D
MTTRRSRGEGGLHFDDDRQRWIATVTVGFDARGKRITRKRSATSKTDAKDKLKEMRRDLEDGVVLATSGYTVTEAVRDWLAFGLAGRARSTVTNYTNIAETRIVAPLGRRKLRDLSAEDVDRWLRAQSREVSTRTLRLMHSILNRAVVRAMARDKVKRNVVVLCTVPTGQAGRPSKSLNLVQAEALLAAATGSTLHAYIVLSLLTGARTEEVRALRWEHIDLAGSPDATPPVPPSISVLRSDRVGGDTKTKKSRRRFAMPRRCVDALTVHRARLGRAPDPTALVFPTRAGTEMDAHNVRRAFRAVAKVAGLDASAWTPRELRHSFVSLLSDSGMPLEQIARLLGHSGTTVTERVYRHQLRPVLEEGADSMDALFPTSEAG